MPEDLQIKSADDIFLKKRNNQKASSTSLTEFSVSKRLKVAHFEFLITSEYKIPPNVFPRLALWSTTMLRAFIALDTIPRMSPNIGMLEMKHISATPFRDSLTQSAIQLPESIMEYINTKLPCIHNIQEKIKLESIREKFGGKIITNSIPTM
ncbi:hypothetical protein D1007_33949 [Hordeum vulgare]|nr:hypothetical protein D1007_33949 [Hordeum vulgare]